LAALPVDAMRTPLGLVPVDRDALEGIRDLSQVQSSEPAHAFEHSLEVQLPFLQQVLADFAVVPLVVGDATDEEVAEVIDRLWGGPETLVVVSSDLSHHHDDATARRMDDATCRAIESLEPGALDWDSACGRLPVRGLLRIAQQRGLDVRTLDLRNSGDTAGSRDSVVGYGAWVFFASAPSDRPDGVGDSPASGTPALCAAQETELLDVARRSIVHGLRHGGPLPIDPAEFEATLRASGAAFVTLRDSPGSLRGCVGSLEARRPLVEDVSDNAWRAAAHDSRFAPVELEELSDLQIHVSILEPPEPLAVGSRTELLEVLRPGRDGLILEDGGRRATFLPQVWESVRGADEFVSLLWQKAGFPPDHWSPSVRAARYAMRPVEAS